MAEGACTLHVARDNETPLQIAKRYGLLGQELVRLNKAAYPGLKPRSKLQPGTRMLLLAPAARAAHPAGTSTRGGVPRRCDGDEDGDGDGGAGTALQTQPWRQLVCEARGTRSVSDRDVLMLAAPARALISAPGGKSPLGSR